MDIPTIKRINRYLIRCQAFVPIVLTVSIYIGVACSNVGAPSSVQLSSTARVTAAPEATPASRSVTIDNVSAAVETTIAEAEEENRTQNQPEWVRARVEALINIWGFTDEGESWLKGYDLRQMVGEPGWAGSYGFEYWAGVGEAIPRVLLHELSHSYWGAFPFVDGVELDWKPSGPEQSEGIQLLRADLHEFMTQPMDRYEPLRDRFRNLPNLTSGDYPDLYHFGEADMIYSTGGNLHLIPPILRKFYVDALSEQGVGPREGVSFIDWGDALGWFLGLSNDTADSPLSDRRVAEDTFGIQHFPLSRYSGSAAIYRTATHDDTTLRSISPEIRAVLEAEERQRLIDFADQFQLIKTNHNEGSDFSFWNSYLYQMRDLHARYPSVLAEAGGDGEELATALDGYIEIEGLIPQDQIEWFDENRDLLFASDFAVLLKPRTILGLFKDSDIGEGAQAGLGFKARELAQIVEPIDEITRLAVDDAAAAVEMLDTFILGLDEERLRSDINLIMDLIRGADSERARELPSNLSQSTYARLFEIAPHAVTRSEMPVEKVLASIGVDSNFKSGEFESGLKFYSQHSSGNFALDTRIEKEIYRLVEGLSLEDTARAFSAFEASGMRINPWLESEHSVAMMRKSIARTAELIMNVAPPRETPAGLIHALVRINPVLAAGVATHIIDNIDTEFGARILSQMAYDAYWRSKGASFIPEPDDTRVFLKTLIDTYGRSWMDEQTADATALASAREEEGDLEPGFKDNLTSSLVAASIQ